MKVKKPHHIYNLNTFGFYRRQIKSQDLDRAFINLLEAEESKKSNIEKINLPEKENFQLHKVVSQKIGESKISNNESNFKSQKSFNLKLIFPKIQIERINKIRDLFLEFDDKKDRTFDADELLVLFNMNKIPITMEEINDLFGFSKKKQILSFCEFIQLTASEEFSVKFKKLIKEKIRHRVKKTDICPNDFNDMLSHLCEFSKLSPELNNKSKEEQLENKDKKKTSKYIEDLGKRMNTFRRTSRKKSLMTMLVESLNMRRKNYDFTNEKDLNEIRQNPNLLKKEREFNNFMDISTKKYLRFKEYLEKMNIRDKILKRKEKLTKAVKVINEINPNIAKNYICYYPTDNKFKNVESKKTISLNSSKKNIKLPAISNCKTEGRINKSNDEGIKNLRRNIYFNIKYNLKPMKLSKNRIIKKYYDSQSKKNRKIKEAIKQKEYENLLAEFSFNIYETPKTENQSNISQNLFANTEINQNINEL